MQIRLLPPSSPFSPQGNLTHPPSLGPHSPSLGSRTHWLDFPQEWLETLVKHAIYCLNAGQLKLSFPRMHTAPTALSYFLSLPRSILFSLPIHICVTLGKHFTSLSVTLLYH